MSCAALDANNAIHANGTCFLFRTQCLILIALYKEDGEKWAHGFLLGLAMVTNRISPIKSWVPGLSGWEFGSENSYQMVPTPVTPAPGSNTSGLCRHLDSCAHIHIHKHAYIKKKEILGTKPLTIFPGRHFHTEIFICPVWLYRKDFRNLCLVSYLCAFSHCWFYFLLFCCNKCQFCT